MSVCGRVVMIDTAPKCDPSVRKNEYYTWNDGDKSTVHVRNDERHADECICWR